MESLKTERFHVSVMSLLQTNFYPIPVVIENITVSAHLIHLTIFKRFS